MDCIVWYSVRWCVVDSEIKDEIFLDFLGLHDKMTISNQQRRTQHVQHFT